jgi:hypothetical protein
MGINRYLLTKFVVEVKALSVQSVAGEVVGWGGRYGSESMRLFFTVGFLGGGGSGITGRINVNPLGRKR